MQILVVVANKYTRSLLTEVEKVSLGTAIVQGLAGPKPFGNSVPSAFGYGERESG